jgi:hypothetical protein
MNHSEYQILKQEKDFKIIRGSDLVNKKDRTLIYGYDTDRNTFHVYLKDEIIYVVKYTFSKEVILYVDEGVMFSNNGYVPNKRIYPACCDAEFCMRLKKEGVYLPFTTFEDRPEEDFYGYTWEEICR